MSKRVSLPDRPNGLVLTTCSATLQPRTFMELRQVLAELQLPDSTREAWDQLF